MKNSIQRTVSIACLILFAGVLRAQPWPPSPLVPPDTTTYSYATEYGKVIGYRRPPDSMIVPGRLIIRFRDGALDSNKLSQTYWTYFDGHKARRKSSAHTLGGPGGPYDQPGEPRGFWPDLRTLLSMERFGLDSANNVIKDSALTSFLLAMGGHALQRLTVASPIDTLSVGRTGDTTGCDLYCWMVLQMDSTTNPLLLTGLLIDEFHWDLVEAWPDYHCTAAGHIPGNDSWHCQVADTMINTPIAWDHEVGDTNILVAHYDYGIDYRHPDFLDSNIGDGHKFKFAWNFAYANQKSYDTINANINDHGTACMGIIAGQTNRDTSTATSICGGWGPLPGGTDTIDRGRGVSAVALGDDNFRTSDYIAAVFEAAARSPVTPFGLGVHVINTSMFVTGGFNSPMHCASNYAYENGVVQTAANGESTAGGEDIFPYDYPANFDPDWIICVGASLNDKNRFFESDYGLSMDLLAPSGDPQFGHCGLPNLTWTARDSSQSDTQLNIPAYFFNGYGGTSISAPQVAGSAGLVLSTFFRQDSVRLKNVEPEDVERMLEAAAWRQDADRDTLPTRNTWRPNSGYGHLDIGNLYTMMDTASSLPLSHYTLYHYSITDTNQMTFGPWEPSDSTFKEQIFQVPTDSRIVQIDTLGKYRERSYLLNYVGGYSGYHVRWRTVTGKKIPVFEASDSIPLFAWGRSGGILAKSGWSLASENFQTGYSCVINGTGGDTMVTSLPAGLEPGIFHNNDTVIVQTIQYDVWGFDSSNDSFDVYMGHCPQDTSLGLNFSIFARPPYVPSSVTEESPLPNDSLSIAWDAQTSKLEAYYNLATPLQNPSLEVYDILGRLVAIVPRVTGNPGWNENMIPTNGLANGRYFCRISSGNYSLTKSFSLTR